MNHSLLTHLFKEDLYQFTAPVVVILSKPWELYSDEQQTLLNKILASVKLSTASVQMLVQPSVDLKLLGVFSPGRVLIFGSATQEQIPLYKETAAQGFIVIKADDLDLLDDQKKKDLWIALRQMFGV